MPQPRRARARLAVRFDELAFAEDRATPPQPAVKSPARPAPGSSATAPSSGSSLRATPSIAAARGCPDASRPTCPGRVTGGG
jgi:hypothetical protein